MSNQPRQRRFCFRNIQPRDPAVHRFGDWPPVNRDFHVEFRRWLQEGGYGASALQCYSVASRFALGLLDKPFAQIELPADLDRVREALAARPVSSATRDMYAKGLLKFEEYLRLRLNRPSFSPPCRPGWSTTCAGTWPTANEPGGRATTTNRLATPSATSPSPCAGWSPTAG